MKNVFVLLSCFVFFISCGSSDSIDSKASVSSRKEVKKVKSKFDADTAKRLGADKYGMRKYVMAFLKRGPNRDRDSLASVALQKAHLENIGKMAEAGKLALAGPFLDDGEIRGIYIFNVETVEEAEALTATDPAIQAGSLVMELHPWYGSAAVTGINEVHKTLSKEKIIEE